MAMAFTRLRPLFRERGAINAEVTGRLAESLGGIRIVKAYTAERREALVFAKGAHKLFRNIAKSMVGVSTVSAVSTLIVGIIGVLMIVVGGRAVLAGTMTLGEFVMYVFFTGLVAAPLVSIASIGTQISDAFAGLDRIREIRSMTTEDAEDADRAPLTEVRGDVRFDDVSFEYDPGVPVLKHVTFHAPAGATTALVGSSGSGKSTLISLVMTFNRPLSGAIYIDGRDLATVRLRDYRGQPRRGAAGQLPVRRHDCREHRLRSPARLARRDRGAWQGSRTATSSCGSSRRGTTPSWGSAA